MIRPFKGRALPQIDERYEVYRRLTGKDHDVVKWSLKDPKTGLVVGHADELLLYDVDLRVHEAGRQKVIATGRKNVHAFAVGRLAQDSDELDLFDTGVHYNPYSWAHFYDDDKLSVRRLSVAHFDSRGKMWA